MTEPKPISEFMDDAMQETYDKGIRKPAKISPEDFYHHARAVENAGFDSAVTHNFDALVKYRWALATGNAKRGLCLMGDVGTGKSLALRVLRIKTRTARMLVKTYETDRNWYDEIIWGYNRRNPEELAIDDLGAEPTLNNYGTKIEVLEEVISERYDLWIACGTLTHITTNLPPKSLDDRYGKRLMSRVHEMAQVVVFEGPDRRKG